MVSALNSGSSGLVSSPSQDIVLCSWTRHFTLTVPLSVQVYKWVLVNLMPGGNSAMD